MADHHDQEGYRVGGQRRYRLFSDITHLLLLGYRGLAFLLHSFVFWLQFTPFAPLLRSARRQDLSERTDEHSLCSALHSLDGDASILDLGAAGHSASEWLVPPIAVSHDLGKHSAWTNSAETHRE